MKIVFAGTPEFASMALEAVKRNGHDIELVLTQPDRPAGRGMKMQPSAVKKTAMEYGIPVEQPVSLKINGKYGEEAQRVNDKIRQIAPDVMVVVAYGLILPKEFLDIPKYGCLNIHASLLPRWRGAAPIQRAIEAGDKETGISIMQMEEGLDTGPVLLQEKIAIDKNVNASQLHDQLAVLGGKMIASALERLDTLVPVPQNETEANYAAKILKEEATLDFTLDATAIADKIRAFNPFPGCVAHYNDVPVKIWKAETANANSGAPAGKIVSADENGIVVACGNGTLNILELQKPGAKRLPVSEFIKGFSFDNGDFK